MRSILGQRQETRKKKKKKGKEGLLGINALDDARWIEYGRWIRSAFWIFSTENERTVKDGCNIDQFKSVEM
ncbi:MAG: hypothetical protein ACRC4N_05400 [Gammaproteobacteria bacterium]